MAFSSPPAKMNRRPAKIIQMTPMMKAAITNRKIPFLMRLATKPEGLVPAEGIEDGAEILPRSWARASEGRINKLKKIARMVINCFILFK